jgi:hypothetical protein
MKPALLSPALLSVALLSACASLVPSTVAQLAAIDPARMDPGAVNVAVVMPPGMRPQPGTAVLIVEGKRSDTGEAVRLEAVLAEQPIALAGFALQPGEAAYMFQVADADLAPLRALQAQIAAWDAAAPDATTGSIAIGVGACTEGTGPAPDAEGAVFIRATAGGPLLPLVPRSRIAGLIGAGALAGLAPCNTAQ